MIFYKSQYQYWKLMQGTVPKFTSIRYFHLCKCFSLFILFKHCKWQDGRIALSPHHSGEKSKPEDPKINIRVTKWTLMSFNRKLRGGRVFSSSRYIEILSWDLAERSKPVWVFLDFISRSYTISTLSWANLVSCKILDGINMSSWTWCEARR